MFHARKYLLEVEPGNNDLRFLGGLFSSCSLAVGTQAQTGKPFKRRENERQLQPA